MTERHMDQGESEPIDLDTEIEKDKNIDEQRYLSAPQAWWRRKLVAWIYKKENQK